MTIQQFYVVISICLLLFTLIVCIRLLSITRIRPMRRGSNRRFRIINDRIDNIDLEIEQLRDYTKERLIKVWDALGQKPVPVANDPDQLSRNLSLQNNAIDTILTDFFEKYFEASHTMTLENPEIKRQKCERVKANTIQRLHEFYSKVVF